MNNLVLFGSPETFEEVDEESGYGRSHHPPYLFLTNESAPSFFNSAYLTNMQLFISQKQDIPEVEVNIKIYIKVDYGRS